MGEKQLTVGVMCSAGNTLTSAYIDSLAILTLKEAVLDGFDIEIIIQIV